MLEPIGLRGTGRVIDDPRVVMGIESSSLTSRAVSWSGVADELPRTFVRCRRDPELVGVLDGIAASTGSRG